MSDSRRGSFSFVTLSLGAAMLSATAFAASMKADGPGKTTPSITVLVTNSRAVALTELDATRTGAYLPKVILRNLAPGKTAPAKVMTGEDCEFDLRGAYSDGSRTESLGVDLCKDKTVKLVD
jgi:hypothetical protein